MKVRGIFFGVVVSIFMAFSSIQETATQEPAIELPVELVGFPVIILAVRLSNFAKKLAYSLNPRTYVSRSRRAIESDDMIDMVEAEKRLVEELGENVCIYTRVCLYHAEKASKTQTKDKVSIDWNDILRLYNVRVRNMLILPLIQHLFVDEVPGKTRQDNSQYKSSKEKHKQYYLLSIFLGDIVASPRFCNQLAKRGRVCSD